MGRGFPTAVTCLGGGTTLWGRLCWNAQSSTTRRAASGPCAQVTGVWTGCSFMGCLPGFLITEMLRRVTCLVNLCTGPRWPELATKPRVQPPQDPPRPTQTHSEPLRPAARQTLGHKPLCPDLVTAISAGPLLALGGVLGMPLRRDETKSEQTQS